MLIILYGGAHINAPPRPTIEAPYLCQHHNLLSLIKSLAYVDGRWCESLGGRRFEVLNPATGQVITQVPDMDGEDTRLAIAAAHAAQPAWAALTAKGAAANSTPGSGASWPTRRSSPAS